MKGGHLAALFDAHLSRKTPFRTRRTLTPNPINGFRATSFCSEEKNASNQIDFVASHPIILPRIEVLLKVTLERVN